VTIERKWIATLPPGGDDGGIDGNANPKVKTAGTETLPVILGQAQR